MLTLVVSSCIDKRRDVDSPRESIELSGHGLKESETGIERDGAERGQARDNLRTARGHGWDGLGVRTSAGHERDGAEGSRGARKG